MGKFFTLLILALIVGGFIYIYPNIEWHSPEVNLKLDTDYLGTKPFDIEMSDKGKGLKSITVKLSNESGETTLFEKTYPDGVMADRVTVTADPVRLGIKEGPAELKVTVKDGSKLKFFSGNKTEIKKKVSVDLEPPAANLISTDHNINHGGSHLVIYKTSPDAVKSGVQVGEYFFPGYKSDFLEDNVYFAFFAYPYNVPAGETITLVAEDAAGNQKTASVPYRLKTIPYRKSNINISDNFITNVITPLAGDSANADAKTAFLSVNSKLRKENDATIRNATTKSDSAILWEGAFHQLSNSKVEANFADERTYVYNGEPIDKQYHLGYDLAVTKRYPIEAANNGIVVYAGPLGIYGNTVIIDHGMGVSTLYGHMSSIDVNVGDEVKKNGIIGKTGQTGLAAGDHLHYGVYVGGVAVRPIEWWDPKWLNDNILLKIRQAKEEFGEGGSGAAQN